MKTTIRLFIVTLTAAVLVLVLGMYLYFSFWLG